MSKFRSAPRLQNSKPRQRPGFLFVTDNSRRLTSENGRFCCTAQTNVGCGTERTCRNLRVESAFGGKSDLTIAIADFRV